MAKITVQRHDGNQQFTQEIDASELGAFKAAGWAEAEPEKPEQDQEGVGGSERVPQTKGAHKPKTK